MKEKIPNGILGNLLLRTPEEFLSSGNFISFLKTRKGNLLGFPFVSYN